MLNAEYFSDWFVLIYEMLPLLHDCLEYGVSGPSCQQAYLVSEYSGAKISVGVTFISLFSDYLSGLITESQSLLSDAPAIIILPVQSNILEQLLKFLSKAYDLIMIWNRVDSFYYVMQMTYWFWLWYQTVITVLIDNLYSL